jgi:hypothetical protein
MRSGKLLLGLVALAVFSGPLAAPAAAQGRAKQVPNDFHFLALQAYNRGDFRSALKGFREAGRSGFASSEGRWIDSICFHAMMGESAYQLGDNVTANEQFTAAIKMFLVHRDWMLRAEFSRLSSQAGSRRNGLGTDDPQHNDRRVPDALPKLPGPTRQFGSSQERRSRSACSALSCLCH